MKPPESPDKEQITLFQIGILLLSLVVFASLIVDSVAKVPTEASRILQILDTAICVVFFFDFCMRFRAAPDKAAFMKWGWIDLVASIPNLDFLRWGRMIRVLRIIRILRAVRSFQRLFGILFRNRMRAGIGSVGIASVLLVVFSSVAVLMAEDTAEANIKTAEDAVWWSMTTITTVGYGDKYPTTTEGRLIAIVLMVSGVGLFGTLSGIVASYFLAGAEPSKSDFEHILTELHEIRHKLELLSDKEKLN